MAASASIIGLATTATASALLLPRIARYAAKLVVLPTFLFIAESHHGIVDALECLFGLRGIVLVRMQFQSPLFVRFLQISLRCLLIYPKDLIVTFIRENFCSNLGLFGSVRLRCWLFLLFAPRWGRLAR